MRTRTGISRFRLDSMPETLCRKSSSARSSRLVKKAAALQYKACIYITFLNKYGNGCGKAFMKAADMDLGPCRLPLSTFDEARYKAFAEELSKTDFNEYKCKK